MTFLVVGLVLFLGVHTVSIAAPGWRDATAARLGEGVWKAGYSLVAGVGLGLIILGYGLARQEPVVLWTPPRGLRHLSLLLMLPVFPLLLATYLPGRVQAAAKHPMLAAVKLWALAHLDLQRHACRRAAVRRLPRLGGGRPHLAQAPPAARHRRARRRGPPTTPSPSSAGCCSTCSSCGARTPG